MRNLLFSGGIFHPFAETSDCVEQQLERLGISSHIVGVRDGFARLREESFDLVTINALSWSMTQSEKYQPFRSEYAFSPSVADQAALTSHLDRGGGLLGLHTAAICFDTWPQWIDILGTGWAWGQSHHPMPDYITVEAGGETFDIWDELYCDLTLGASTKILANGRVAGVEMQQPVLTAKDRAVYLALGHDMTATGNPDYARLLAKAAQIALGQMED